MSRIMTCSHKMFDPLAPETELIDIADIAHALSMLCRANGHFRSFYSVGMHCINCAREAKARNFSRKVQLAGTLINGDTSTLNDKDFTFKCVNNFDKGEAHVTGFAGSKKCGSLLSPMRKVNACPFNEDSEKSSRVSAADSFGFGSRRSTAPLSRRSSFCSTAAPRTGGIETLPS